MKTILLLCGLLLSNASSDSPEVNSNSDHFFSGYEDQFLDISGLAHRFPKEVKELDFPTTLLHKHQHAHGYLVFSQNYNESHYAYNVDGLHPCSWHLDHNKQPKAYEYCEQENEYNITEVKERLDLLTERGYTNYGTTNRDIGNKIELETDKGHVYVAMNDNNYRKDEFFSETSVHGSKYDDCTWVIGCVENIFRDHEKRGQRHEYDPPSLASKKISA